jgi:hypothetical protein
MLLDAKHISMPEKKRKNGGNEINYGRSPLGLNPQAQCLFPFILVETKVISLLRRLQRL